MGSTRTTGVVAGVFFVVATVTAVVALRCTSPP